MADFAHGLEYLIPGIGPLEGLYNANCAADVIANLTFLAIDLTPAVRLRLLSAGSIIDRAGLTVAGRALQKHGGRSGSIFPKAIGNPSRINLQANEILSKKFK